MSDPMLPSFHKTLEQLQSYGLKPPDGAVDVVAVGGGDFPHLPQESYGQALREVTLDLGASTTDSVEQSQHAATSSNPSVAPSGTDAFRGSGTSSGPSTSAGVGRAQGRPSNGSDVNPSGPGGVPRNSRPAHRGKPTGQRRNTKRINEYFEEKFSMEGSVQKISYKCRQCGFFVTQQKQRERLFHIILCSKIPVQTRTTFYLTCGAKDRPPLLEHPVLGITASDARKLVRVQHENMLSQMNCLRLAFDPSREPSFARYLLETERVKKSTPIGQCSEEETKMATDLVMQFVVEENMSFAICDRADNSPRPFRKLLSFLRPGYELPLGYLVRTKLLDQYYCTYKRDMQLKLRTLLKECRGTLMFDGSEDVNGAPMISILMRVMGSSRISTSTFFLALIYTGYDTVDAKYYVNMAEKVVEQFGGFANIAGVVTDNTGSVKNAREMLQRKYPRLVASQDQAHVADRLMADLGEIPWIRNTLDKLSKVSSVLRRYRKMKAKMIELMKEHNNAVKLSQTADKSAPGDADAGTSAEDPQNCDSESEIYQVNAELSRLRLPQDTVSEVGSFATTEESNDVNEDEGHLEGNDQARRTVSQETVARPPRTAVTMKKLSAVRFASSEKLLEEYLRLRPVLLKLVADSSFDKLYSAKNEAERRKRDSSFVDVIRSDELEARVKQIHDIFRACRTYLRVFDSETSMASEVFEATRILKETLESLPLEAFPDPREEERQELLEVFENRRVGPFPGRKQIKISLLSDLHITAALLDPYRTPVSTPDYMEAFNRHLIGYMSGVDLSTLSLNEIDREIFLDEIINQYLIVRARWIEKGMMRELSESSTRENADQGPSDRCKRVRSPLVWWTTGWIVKPADPFERKAAEELIEFAIRTLSVSPTATATERTFSLENRIHTSQRANLAPERVRKLMFCQWNSYVLRRSIQRDEIDIKWEIERQMEAMRRLLLVRSTIKAASREAPDTSAVLPTATDQNMNRHNGRERHREENEEPDCRDTALARHIQMFEPMEGMTVETLMTSQPKTVLQNEHNAALHQDAFEVPLADEFEASEQHEIEVDKPDMLAGQNSIQRQRQTSEFGKPPPTQPGWVSELFQAALRTTLEYHGLRQNPTSPSPVVSDPSPSFQNPVRPQDLPCMTEKQGSQNRRRRENGENDSSYKEPTAV